MTQVAQPAGESEASATVVPAQPRPTTAAAEQASARPADGSRSRRELWLWVWGQSRPYVGWVLAGLGALALFLGWYGVSGEALTAKQIPYLVSGGLTGVALVVLAAVFLATDDVRRQLGKVRELERKVDALYGLFVAELSGDPRPGDASTATGTVAVVALPSGSSYHRPDCALVVGKTGAATVTAGDIASRSLRPCRVCDPPAAV